MTTYTKGRQRENYPSLSFIQATVYQLQRIQPNTFPIQYPKKCTNESVRRWSRPIHESPIVFSCLKG